MKPIISLLALCLAIIPLLPSMVATARADEPGLYDRQNLTAWCVVPFDAKKRGSEDRAKMLKRLGFRNFAYDWRENDIPTFDNEIEVMNNHGINIVAWWFPGDAGDPTAKTILEAIKRHGIHPQLWVAGSGGPTKSEVEQMQRIDQEAERILKIVKLAAPYDCQVELYNHDGWFGQETNEVSIIDRLNQKGVNGVGMVYNFTHGHEDIADFPAIWNRIKAYVVAVNISGMVKLGDGVSSGRVLAPSEGDCELEMMRIIQQSGWRGPVGLIAEQGGDAEVSLSNDLQGIDWLKKEVSHPGSGGERPRFSEVTSAAN